MDDRLWHFVPFNLFSSPINTLITEKAIKNITNIFEIIFAIIPNYIHIAEI